MSPFVFPRDVRLLRSREFSAVFRQNILRISNSRFLILARQNGSTCSRLGIIISKRTTPTSVKRNAFKRIVREAFRHADQSKKPLDIIVLARSGVNSRSGRSLRQDLDTQFGKLEDLAVGDGTTG